jgi:hypothetical protein
MQTQTTAPRAQGLEIKMQITLKQIKDAMAAKDYSVLRALHNQAKTDGIEDCDEMQLSTLNLAVLEVSVFRGDVSFERILAAMIGKK